MTRGSLPRPVYLAVGFMLTVAAGVLLCVTSNVVVMALTLCALYFGGYLVRCFEPSPPCEGCAGRDTIIIELTDDLDREQPCVVCDMRRDFE
jgi:hypothetical protein